MRIPSGFKYLIPAGLFALIATYLIHQYLTAQAPVEVKRVGQVLVAEVDLTPGTTLSDRMVRIAQWPEEIIPGGTIREPKQVVGRVVQVPICKGEPIMFLKMAPEGTAAGLGGLLDPNKLAVTVRTDDVSGVAGFINPGDRVDILVEMPAPGTSGEHFSKLILQNIKVLSKGQSTEQAADKKPEVVNTVTLELSPDQAEVINLASFQGKIRLALRNRLNRAEFSTTGVITSQISYKPGKQQTEEAAPAPQKKAREERHVDVIKGTQRLDATY